MADSNDREQSISLDEALVRSFTGFNEERAAMFGEFAEVQTINQFLLQREARRLERRLGADHPRAEALAKRLDRSRDVVRDLSAEAEIARIRVPTVGEKDVLVYGRVTDERLHGVGGLLVSFTDEAGKPQRAHGRSESDVTGAFSLSIAAAERGKAPAETETPLFLGVFSPRGDLLHRTFDPVQLEPGARILVEIRLNAEEVIPLKLRRTERATRGAEKTTKSSQKPKKPTSRRRTPPRTA
jgi:hypothetical protein